MSKKEEQALNSNIENLMNRAKGIKASSVLEVVSGTSSALPETTGFKIEKEEKENKSKRVQLLIKPSTYEELKEVAEKSGVSVNNFINQAIEHAIKEVK